VGIDVADHCGTDPLAPLRVRSSVHRSLLDPGKRQQDGLDLGGVDIQSAADDQVGPAAVEVQEAIRVEAAQVADSEPLGPVDLPPRRCRLVRVPPVLEASACWRSAPDDPVLDAQLPIRTGASDRADVVGPLGPGHRGELPLG
jgi:hypothetical protein